MFYDNFKRICKEKNIYPTKVITDLKLSQTNMTNWKNGRTPRYDIVKKIADYLNVSVSDLLSDDNYSQNNEENKKTKGIRIPILGKVQAGIPIEASEEPLGYEEITQNMANQGEHFGLIIRGDSMEPRFIEGDIAIVRQQSDVDNGKVAVVLINGTEATIKRINKTGNGIYLIANNPSYEPKYYTNQQIEELPVQIIGEVVELRARTL